MIITVSAKPSAKKDIVEKITDSSFRISLKAPATEGKANEALIKLLAKHFSKPQSHILLKKGQGSRHKVIEIL